MRWKITARQPSQIAKRRLACAVTAVAERLEDRTLLSAAAAPHTDLIVANLADGQVAVALFEPATSPNGAGSVIALSYTALDNGQLSFTQLTLSGASALSFGQATTASAGFETNADVISAAISTVEADFSVTLASASVYSVTLSDTTTDDASTGASSQSSQTNPPSATGANVAVINVFFTPSGAAANSFALDDITIAAAGPSDALFSSNAISFDAVGQPQSPNDLTLQSQTQSGLVLPGAMQSSNAITLIPAPKDPIAYATICTINVQTAAHHDFHGLAFDNAAAGVSDSYSLPETRPTNIVSDPAASETGLTEGIDDNTAAQAPSTPQDNVQIDRGATGLVSSDAAFDNEGAVPCGSGGIVFDGAAANNAIDATSDNSDNNPAATAPDAVINSSTTATTPASADPPPENAPPAATTSAAMPPPPPAP